MLLRFFNLRDGLRFVLLLGCTVSQLEYDLTTVLDEASVEVGECNELLDRFQRLDWLNFLQGVYIFVRLFDFLA